MPIEGSYTYLAKNGWLGAHNDYVSSRACKNDNFRRFFLWEQE